MEENTRQVNVRTVGECNKPHLYQVVICQENPLQIRTRSGVNQVNLIAEGQEMIVEQRDKPRSFIDRNQLWRHTTFGENSSLPLRYREAVAICNSRITNCITAGGKCTTRCEVDAMITERRYTRLGEN